MQTNYGAKNDLMAIFPLKDGWTEEVVCAKTLEFIHRHRPNVLQPLFGKGTVRVGCVGNSLPKDVIPYPKPETSKDASDLLGIYCQLTD